MNYDIIETRKNMKKLSIYTELFLAFIVLLALSMNIEGQGINDFVKLILTISTFLFAITLAFSTANRHTRLNSIRHTLRNDDAVLLSIYRSSKIFGKKTADQCRNYLDKYIVKSIDHVLEDFEESTPEFLQLYEFILNLKPKNEPQKVAKSQMLDDARDSMKNQKEVIYWVNDDMQNFEWISLIALCATIIWCLFYINDGTFFAMFVIPVLGVSLILLLLVVRDLNRLMWQENRWIWEPLTQLFQEIDLLPYYTDELIRHDRVKEKDLKKLKAYRVGYFPNTYPDNSGKTVKTIKNTR